MMMDRDGLHSDKSDESMHKVGSFDQDHENFETDSNKEESDINGTYLDSNKSCSSDEHKWHVVGVSKNRESSLQRTLVALIDLPEENIKRVYLPKETIRSWKNNQQVDTEKPVMNYLFVLARPGYLENRDSKMMIKTKYHVLGTISDQEIGRMEQEFADNMPVLDFKLKVGTEVQILRGSFAGLNGKIQDLTGDGYATVRIWLMQDCEPTDIEVQLGDVGPVNDKQLPY